MRNTHIAIIHHGLGARLLDGAKTIESRLMRTRRPPYGRVRRGDRICFKLSGGALIGSAVVARVREFADLRPADVRDLQRRYSAQVAAPRSYWRDRRAARYAVLIWLERWTRAVPGCEIPRQFGGAWLSLDPSQTARRRCRAPRRSRRARPVMS